MERAANDLSLTPSALTRRIQRLEIELGAVLFDRHFKPPKLTQAGLEILGKGRAILSSLSDLKNSTSGGTPPLGPFSRCGAARHIEGHCRTGQRVPASSTSNFE